jgi:hypothetical protein
MCAKSKKELEVKRSTERFVQDWTSYALARQAVALSRENRIKTNPSVYHSLVDWANEFSGARVDVAKNGLGIRTLDDIELNRLAPDWHDAAKPAAFQYAENKYDLILQGLRGPRLKQIISLAPAANPDRVAPKYKSFARMHRDYQDTVSALQQITDKDASEEEKIDVFNKVIYPMAVKILKRTMGAKRLPNKKGLPHADRLTSTFSYIASINPAYAKQLVMKELPKITERFGKALDKLAVDKALDYLRSVHDSIATDRDPTAREKQMETYFDAIYRVVRK